MLAEKNKYIEEAVVTLRQMSAEEKIREQCEARERYHRDMATAIAKGRQEGREEGRAEGRREGLEEGKEKMEGLIMKLIADNRLSDLEKFQSDKSVLQKLFEEYNL